MTNEGIRLIIPGQAGARKKTKRAACLILAMAAAAFTAVLLLTPAGSGMAVLINRLMDESEAVNAYSYRRISAAPSAEAEP